MKVVGPFLRNSRSCNGMRVRAGASWPREEAPTAPLLARARSLMKDEI